MRLWVLPVLLVALVAAAPPPPPERPVMVGKHADLDACLSDAQVTGLNPRGDNFLAVRSRPSVNAREIGRLRSGQLVAVCEESGAWSGVVFSPSGRTADCGTGTPASRHQPYRGPCASGWVASRFLKIIAG